MSKISHFEQIELFQQTKQFHLVTIGFTKSCFTCGKPLLNVVLLVFVYASLTILRSLCYISGSGMSIIAIVEEAIHLLAADARDMPSSLVVIFHLSCKPV